MLELPTSRLTVGRANQLRHGDLFDESLRMFWIYKQSLVLCLTWKICSDITSHYHAQNSSSFV